MRAMPWRFKSPASRLFAEPIGQAQIQENIKTPRHWPLWGESTGNWWVPLIKGQQRGHVFIWWRHHEEVKTTHQLDQISWYKRGTWKNDSNCEFSLIIQNIEVNCRMITRSILKVSLYTESRILSFFLTLLKINCVVGKKMTKPIRYIPLLLILIQKTYYLILFVIASKLLTWKQPKLNLARQFQGPLGTCLIPSAEQVISLG